MFKIDKNTNKITITKGDNAELEIKVFDADGKERGIYDDDTVVMTVRKTADSDSVSFAKSANTDGVIEIVPADTNSLASGTYVYDVQLTTFTKKIYTIIPVSYFVIDQEVTQ